MRPPACLFAALAAALLAAPAAGATIVVNKGIGGVTIGMTGPMVRSVLGQPARTKRGTNDFGAYTILTYRRPAISVTFQGNAAATAVETRSRSERTASGVGAGSTEAAVKAKVRSVKCRTESGFRHCYVGSFKPGTRVTDFTIRGGKVTRVVVGIVID